MEKELFDSVNIQLNKNLLLKNKKLADIYENFYELLNEIIETNFYDLNSGRLVVFPVGDYISQTISESSIIDFDIIYQTSRDIVDFAVINQKITRKGKKKLSTLQSLVGRPTESGKIQAEGVAERIAFCLKEKLKASQFVFQKRNEIVVNYGGNTVKINVVYDLNTSQDETVLTQRYINRWQKVNPIKYLNNIDKKDKNTNGNFRFFIKFFKAMELEVILAGQSNLLIGKNCFVENLLYNVPNELYINDEKLNILDKLIIYLKNSKLENFNLIDETGKMFDKKYNKNYAKQFINKMNYAINNFELVLELSANNNKNDDE